MPASNEPSADNAGGFPAYRQAGGGWHSPNQMIIVSNDKNK